MGKAKRKREDDDDNGDHGGGANSRACLPCVGDRTGPAAAAEADDSDSEGPPMDGYAYLRRVMREARSCPQTVVAKNREALLGAAAGPREAAARHIPDYLVPKRAWRAGVLADFRALRASFAAQATPRGQRLPDPPAGLPSSRDGTSWKAYCFGSKAGSVPHAPSLEALLALEQVTVSWLVVCHKNWLCNSPSPHCSIPAELEGGGAGSTKLQSRYRMCHQALLGGVEGGTCGSVSWLHTILACIEEPLAPADETALAELVYTLCQLWTQVCVFFF